MAVTVITARDEHGGPTTREVFAAANKYVINDGNLDIIVQGAGPLGTYASGNWMSVYMDDSVEITTTKTEEDDGGFGDFSFDSDDSSDASSDDSSDDSSDAFSFDADNEDADSEDADSADADSEDAEALSGAEA
jgi:hypothetical protein